MSASPIAPSPREAMNASTAMSPNAGGEPEAARRRLARPQHREDRRPGREQRDHHRAVGGVDVLEGERGEEREGGDDAERDDRERAPLGAARAGRAQRSEHGGAEHGGDHGAAEGDEHRVQVGDREPGGREGEREDGDAERGEREAAQLRAAGLGPAMSTGLRGGLRVPLSLRGR